MALAEKSYSGRLVIVHQGALGDFLLALPIFDGLHRSYPEALIDFCSRPVYEPILQTKTYFGRLYSAESSLLTSLYHDDLWQGTRLAPYLLQARSIFLFGQDRSRILAGRLARLVNCEPHWVRSFPASDWDQPVTRFLMDQLRKLGFEFEYLVPRVDPLPQEKRAVQEWMISVGWSQRSKPIIIHPGSGGREKIWPLNRWWSLLEWLCAKYDHPLLMVLGEADQHLGPFAAGVKELGIRLLENVSLQRLAALLDESKLYVGNDSGVSHLAAAVGAPTVAIFGPTRPEVWAPQGPEVRVIKSQWDESANLLWSPGASGFDEDVKAVIESVLG